MPGRACHDFTFDTDPFAGTNVLSAPGRQVVAGENFINFNPATDVFSLDSSVFNVGTTVNFVNALAPNLPTGGVNVVVLQSLDNDNNPATPFGAPNAADLIASHITTPGPGFFIYFNQALDLPRLVFSEDLSSSNADLKILARMINLNGQTGRDALPAFTAANFAFNTDAPTGEAPEPSTFAMIVPVGVICAFWYLRRRRKQLHV